MLLADKLLVMKVVEKSKILVILLLDVVKFTSELISFCVAERLFNLAKLVVKLNLVVKNLLFDLGTLLRLKPSDLKFFVKLLEFKVFNLSVIVFLSSDRAVEVSLFCLCALGLIVCSDGVEFLLNELLAFDFRVRLGAFV